MASSHFFILFSTALFEGDNLFQPPDKSLRESSSPAGGYRSTKPRFVPFAFYTLGRNRIPR